MEKFLGFTGKELLVIGVVAFVVITLVSRVAFLHKISAGS